MCRPWIRSMKPWHDLQESEVRRNYNTTSFLFAAQGSTFYNVVLPRSKLVCIFPSNYVAIIRNRMHRPWITGWWFGTWIFWLSIYWECHHPNWRTHIFQRGWNHQADHFWTFWSCHFFSPWNFLTGGQSEEQEAQTVARETCPSGCVWKLGKMTLKPANGNKHGLQQMDLCPNSRTPLNLDFVFVWTYGWDLVCFMDLQWESCSIYIRTDII